MTPTTEQLFNSALQTSQHALRNIQWESRQPYYLLSWVWYCYGKISTHYSLFWGHEERWKLQGTVNEANWLIDDYLPRHSRRYS